MAGPPSSAGVPATGCGVADFETRRILIANKASHLSQMLAHEVGHMASQPQQAPPNAPQPWSTAHAGNWRAESPDGSRTAHRSAGPSRIPDWTAQYSQIAIWHRLTVQRACTFLPHGRQHDEVVPHRTLMGGGPQNNRPWGR